MPTQVLSARTLRSVCSRRRKNWTAIPGLEPMAGSPVDCMIGSALDTWMVLFPATGGHFVPFPPGALKHDAQSLMRDLGRTKERFRSVYQRVELERLSERGDEPGRTTRSFKDLRLWFEFHNCGGSVPERLCRLWRTIQGTFAAVK